MEYFEQKNHWNKNYFEISAEKDRIESIFRELPNEITTLMDVGCGNGAFLNALLNNKSSHILNRVVGIDTSIEALGYVKSDRLIATAINIPFINESFDIITCLEVLEHLKFAELEKALKELLRVADKYILITVPNDELLEDNHRQCPYCKCMFHPYYHINSFDTEKLKALFVGKAKCLKVLEIGPKKYPHNTLITKIRNSFTPLMPNNTSICPQCGFNRTKIFSINIQKSQNKFLKKLYLTFVKYFTFSKNKKWLLALYSK